MANGAIAAPEMSAPGLGEHPDSKRGFQKRIDRLTRDKYELRQANGELRDLLLKYEATIERYKLALRKAKKVNG